VTGRHIPNILTLFRVVLVVPIAVSLLEGRPLTTLVLFALAGITDGLDGYLARRFNWQSRLGGILDPLADKILLLVVYCVLGWMTLLPVWLVVAVVLRDVVIVSGFLVYQVRISQVDTAPLLVSKFNTVLQIGLVLLVVLAQVGMSLPEWLLTGLIFAVLSTTVISGVGYVWVWSRKAIRHSDGSTS